MKVTVKTPRPVTPPPVYTLELSEKEARILRAFMGGTCFRDIRDTVYSAMPRSFKVSDISPSEIQEFHDNLFINLRNHMP